MDAREIKIWRMDHNLTLEQMATRLGKHRNTVWNWENGVARVPVTLRADLARIAKDLATSAGNEPETMRQRGHTYRRHAETGVWTSDTDAWTLETNAQARLDRDCARPGDVELAARPTRTTWHDRTDK